MVPLLGLERDVVVGAVLGQDVRRGVVGIEHQPPGRMLVIIVSTSSTILTVFADLSCANCYFSNRNNSLATLYGSFSITRGSRCAFSDDIR
ncbi:MAG: hypothetical protein ABGY96_18835 [bacterium]